MNVIMLLNMLLVFAQAPVPIPRQASYRPAASGQQTTPDSRSVKAAGSEQPALVDVVRSEIAKWEDAKKRNDDEGKNVVISKLPTVTLAKTGLDASTIANYLLVAVGLLGIGTAWNTLRVVKTQADTMEGQIVLMREQNKIARDRERARLSVVASKAPEVLKTVPLFEGDVAIGVSMGILNEGPTKAFNVRAKGIMGFANEMKAPYPSQQWNLNVPQTIGDTDRHGHVDLRFAPIGISSSYVMIPEDWLIQMQKRKRFLQISGLLTYEDLFGGKHETVVNQTWMVSGNEVGGVWDDDSFWRNNSC